MKPGDEAYLALCGTLREEAKEQIERIGAALLEIERGADARRMRTLLEEAFRQAHNLKGAAGSLGFTLTAALAHALEDVLGQLRSVRPVDALKAFDILHRGLSAVAVALDNDPGGETHPEVTPIIEQLDAFRSARNTSVPPGPAAPTNAPRARRSRGSGPPSARGSEPSLNELASAATGASGDSGPRSVRTGSAPKGLGAARTELTREPEEDARVDSRETVARVPKSLTQRGQRPNEESLRVSTRKLGALMAQVGELLAARLRTDQRLAELRSILSIEEERLDRRAAFRTTMRDHAPAELDPFSTRLLEALNDTLETQKGQVRRLRELVRAFEADALQSTILSGELQEDIRRIQTFPLASVLDPLPRAVRNMAREVGKEAELVVEGAELELDKKVLEALRDPLYHLLRNGVDHGIETPDQRLASGKPGKGKLVISAEHRGDAITISLSDDGPGIDLDTVRVRAVERGLLPALEAAHATEPQLLDLLFSPGFTTKQRPTSLSGRGVGLDAVRANIEDLQGNVTLSSRRGQGTTVNITLPLTIYVVHALIVRIGTHEMAMPISSIQRILRVDPREVVEVEHCDVVIVDGRPIALVSLAALLGVEADPRREGRIGVVVIGLGDQRCALAVDEIVGDQTVLAKNLEPPLIRIPNIAGATIRGDGTVLLTLNPVDLLRSAIGHSRARGQIVDQRSEPIRARRLLLVDDSFTTRALEKSVFELAGFDVVAVADAEEALDVLDRDAGFDALISDVAMPGLSGFDLCRRLRADQRYRTLPVVLVTSLASEEDRRHGLDAGADAYVAKQEFDHEQLVATVHELIGRA